jgi:hypothetical protein
MDGKLKVNGIEYILTKHARDRAKKRKITEDDIREAIADTKILRPSRAFDTDCSTYVLVGRNKVLLVLDNTKRIIITVHHANKSYHNAKTKCKRNKRQVKNKKLYGNRAK